MHVAQFLDPLPLAPHVEVIEPGLPKRALWLVREQFALPRVAAPSSRQQRFCRALFQHLHYRRGITHFRFREQKVDVFRHDHVTDDHKTVPTPRLLKNGEETVASIRGTEQGHASIARIGDKVQVMSTIAAMQADGHDQAMLPGSMAPALAKSARAGHPRFRNGKGTSKGGPPATGKRPCAIVLLCILTTIVSPAQNTTFVTSFDGSNGADPGYPYVMSPVQGLDGSLYGTTGNTGSGIVGTVFKVTPVGNLTTLHSFVRGVQPAGGLVLAADGSFYGTTNNGGIDDHGMIFKIGPTGTYKVLYRFCAQANCPDGANPGAGLVQGTDGQLYGTTVHGGVSDHGTVFKITTIGTLTNLYSFCPKAFCKDGNHPRAALIQAMGGDFYGTTEEGGAHQAGTIFKIDRSGFLTTLYSFCARANCADGESPVAALVQANDGNFYSTTQVGGTNNVGTVFKITPKGTFTTLYNFCTQNYPSCADGSGPYAALVQATDGNFYGTTGHSGVNGSGTIGVGTVFEITTGGKLSTLHTFCAQTGCTDGALPQGGVVQGTDGNFYGTTQVGGANDDGIAFGLSAGLGPFVEALPYSGKAGKTIKILGQGLTGATAVSFNGTPASFMVQSDTYLTTTIPVGATTGSIAVTTPDGVLTSNREFRVLQ